MFDLPKYGDGVCLARMAALLDALAIDRTRLQTNSVVITGSNGKGSTAAFCAEIARAHGLRTGLFTSPHLFHISERFRVDGEPIDDETLKRFATRIETAIAAISRNLNERFGAFEAMFALACLHFQENGCEFSIFEAGIGGRYDPVRLVGSSLAAVTSVDYEHVELLGPSLQLIVSDKSDACACGGTVIYGENCRELKPLIIEYNRNRKVESLFVRDDIKISGETASPGGQRFDFAFGDRSFRTLETALMGGFQFNNAAIAIALLLRWLDRAGPGTTAAIEAATRSALRQTRWPGRLEVIESDPLTVIDVGHTPDGIRQSLASLRHIHGEENWLLVFGVSFDKKAGEIAAALAPSFDTIICTTAHHKGSDPASLAATVRQINPEADIHVANTIEQALRTSRSLAAARKLKIYVTGGLFTAIEFAAVARGLDPKQLAFF